MGPAVIVPVVAGVGIVGTLVALRLRAVSAGSGPKSLSNVPPPNFSTPPAAQAVPAGKSTAGIPVITADQFKALDAGRQETIRQDALNGILTLTSTNGTLFTEKTPATDTFVGVFKPGEDLRGMLLVVDTALAKRFGTTIPGVSDGNSIWEPLAANGQTHVKAISRDPRIPNVTMDLPINAITGAGDP
jgi:hypothetical protein